MYHLFASDDFEPNGGLTDYVGWFATLEECDAWLTANCNPHTGWAQAEVGRDGKLVEVCSWTADRGEKKVRTDPATGYQYTSAVQGWKRVATTETV